MRYGFLNDLIIIDLFKYGRVQQPARFQLTPIFRDEGSEVAVLPLSSVEDHEGRVIQVLELQI